MNRVRHKQQALLNLMLASALVLTGCAHKGKSSRQQAVAFETGRQQGIRELSEARRVNIRVIGNVRNAEVQWRDDLTLAQVIVEAQLVDGRTPGSIFIYRQRARLPVMPEYLLRGGDVTLQPGDTVEIRPP